MADQTHDMSGSDGWIVLEALCAACGRVWIAVRPASVEAHKLECPKCGSQESVTLLCPLG